MDKTVLTILRNELSEIIRGIVKLYMNDSTLIVEIDNGKFIYKYEVPPKHQHFVDLSDTDMLYYIIVRDYQNYINALYFKS